MKNLIYGLALVLLAVNSGQVKATELSKVAYSPHSEGAVCFVDFRIGLVVGKSEADISNDQYCKYAVNQKKFLGLLTHLPNSTFYMSDNVRAKVSFSSRDIYFIDYNGVVRHGEEKFQINKMKFTEALRRLGK